MLHGPNNNYVLCLVRCGTVLQWQCQCVEPTAIATNISAQHLLQLKLKSKVNGKYFVLTGVQVRPNDVKKYCIPTQCMVKRAKRYLLVCCFLFFNKGKFILLSDQAIYRNNTHTHKNLQYWKHFQFTFSALCPGTRTAMWWCASQEYSNKTTALKKNLVSFYKYVPELQNSPYEVLRDFIMCVGWSRWTDV